MIHLRDDLVDAKNKIGEEPWHSATSATTKDNNSDSVIVRLLVPAKARHASNLESSYGANERGSKQAAAAVA